MGFLKDINMLYPATVRQMVAQSQLGLIAAGSTVSVRVDPTNPSTVLLAI